MKRAVELKADRRLLEPQFEGYRLGGRAPAGQRVPLPSPPPRLRPCHRSLLHARLLALHNALVPGLEPAEPHAYFVDAHAGVWHVRFETELILQRVLAPLPQPALVLAPHHPPTLMLLPDGWALLAAPPARLLIVRTGSNPDDDVIPARDCWTIEAELEPLGPDVCFSLLDARFQSDENDTSYLSLHCLLQSINQEEKQSVNIVEWIVLNLVNGCWIVNPHTKLRGLGALYYCALETTCDALYAAGDRPLDFIKTDDEIAEELRTSPESNLPKKTYSWKQTSEDISLTIELNAIIPNTAPVVDTSRDFIFVSYDDIEYVRGILHGEIEHELTTWTVENNTLKILLLKCNTGIVWFNLLKDGDPDGEQELDRVFVDEVHSRLAHLCSETEVAPENAPLFNTQQLEECDFVAEEESCLVRLDPSMRRITHQAFLSSHQMILNVRMNSTEVTALGLRHDADTCIWQPRAALDGDWPVEHEGTLLAFGYVQSSKQQKKYTVCSPNLEYSVVCEANRHAFIYRQEWNPQKHSQLRYRKPDGENRRVKVGKQQLISFDRDEEVFGICATNEILFVLTENNIIAFEMSE